MMNIIESTVNISDAINEMNKMNNIINENDNDKTPYYEEMNLLTPYSTSYPSHSNTNHIMTNSLFPYDSDTNDDPIELSLDHNVSLSTLYIADIADIADSEDDNNNNNNNNDNDDDDDDIDIDLIPLIDRITPPPPLFINNSITSSDDDEYDDYHHNKEEGCTIFTAYIDTDNDDDDEHQHDDHDGDDDDDHDHNIDDEEIMDDYYDDNGVQKSFPFKSNKDDWNINKIKKEKTFTFNIPNHCNMYKMNNYLIAHIDSLIDDNLSE